MNCNDAEELLFKFEEGEASESEIELLKDHLQGCTECLKIEAACEIFKIWCEGEEGKNIELDEAWENFKFLSRDECLYDDEEIHLSLEEEENVKENAERIKNNIFKNIEKESLSKKNMEKIFPSRYWKLVIAAGLACILATVLFSPEKKRYSFALVDVEETVLSDGGVYTLSQDILTLKKSTDNAITTFYKNAEKSTSIVLDWTDYWSSNKNTISLDNLKNHYSIILSQINLTPSDVRKIDIYRYSQFPNPDTTYRSHQNDSQGNDSNEGAKYESGLFYRDFYEVESFPNKWKLLFRIKQFSPLFVPRYKLGNEVVVIENGLKMGEQYQFLVGTNEDMNMVVLVTQEIDISSRDDFEWQAVSKNTLLKKDFPLDSKGKYYLYCIFSTGEPNNDLLQKFIQSEIIKELVGHLSKADFQREFLAVSSKANNTFSVYAAVLVVQ